MLIAVGALSRSRSVVAPRSRRSRRPTPARPTSRSCWPSTSAAPSRRPTPRYVSCRSTATRIGGPAAPASGLGRRSSRRQRPRCPKVDPSRSLTQTAIIVHSTQRRHHRAVPRSDNYVFKQLAALPTDELVIDRPYPTPTAPRQYILPLARRVTNDAGRFGGIIVAVVVPERVPAVLPDDRRRGGGHASRSCTWTASCSSASRRRPIRSTSRPTTTRS